MWGRVSDPPYATKGRCDTGRAHAAPMRSLAPEGVLQLLDHILPLLHRHLGVDRQGDNGLRGGLGVREVALLVPQEGVGWLYVQWDGIVDADPQPRLLHAAEHLVAVRNPYHVLVEYGPGPLRHEGGLHHSVQHLSVGRGVLPAGLGPCGQVAQLGPQYSGLQGVHPLAVAHVVVAVLLRAAVVGHHGAPAGQLLVVCGYHSGVAVGPQVLAGVEAEAGGRPNAAHLAALVLRAVGLAGVLQNRQTMEVGDLQNGVHVHRLAVQVHRHDHLGLRGDLLLDPGWVYVVGAGIDVHKDGYAPAVGDGLGRGDEGVGGGDHLVRYRRPEPGTGVPG